MTAMSSIHLANIDQTDLVAVIHAYNDVTERLKHSHDLLAREVCRLREKLQEKNKELQRRERLTALGQMAAGVAHEIRNPLGGIGLYASLLERDLADQPKQQELVRKLSCGIRNVESIVSDILAFAGDAEPHCRPVPLGQIIGSALEQTARQADEHGITIQVDRTLSSVELFCDAGQMERAIINLVLNALDAAGAGGNVWIRRGSGEAPAEPASHNRDGANGDSHCPIVVEDNGPGIAPELVQRVFDPFFTTKDTGTGLGLAIVHRIAESNGGSVRASSRRGGGASFVLSVPLACRSTTRTAAEPTDGLLNDPAGGCV